MPFPYGEMQILSHDFPVFPSDFTVFPNIFPVQ